MINCKECIHYEPCKAWASGNILCDITPDAFCDYFKEKTTVGAEPVKHGKWIENYGAPNVKRCSVCKAERHAKESWWSYCPKCGAKMDGKAGEQE